MSRYRFYDETPPRAIISFVPAGQVEAPSGKGWTIRRRGDLEGSIKHTYRCPVHGQFDAYVSRAEVPDEVRCGGTCGIASPWAGSLCGIGWAAGEVTG